MSEPRVLRLSPLLDWREVDPPADGATAVGGMAAQVARQTAATDTLGVPQTVLALPAGTARAGRLGGARVRAVGREAGGVHRTNLAWLAGVVVRLPLARRRHDVVHVHASGIVEPLVAALAARALTRLPLVLTLHCSAQATYVAVSRRDKAVQVVTRAAERAAIRAAGRTLVLTERVRGALGGARMEVMPDWVDTSRFAEPRGGGGAVYVGRISAEKGWPALVELAARLPQLRLRVLGDGPDLGALREAVRARGLEERVTLAGAVAAERVAEELATADVLVLPSVHEELGSVLLEAMAAGVPAVAYAVGGVPEAIDDGRTGLLVAPGDVEALATAVTRAHIDGRLRGRARTDGRQRARDVYDAGRQAPRLAAIYREVARCG